LFRKSIGFDFIEEDLATVEMRGVDAATAPASRMAEYRPGFDPFRAVTGN